MKKIFLGLILSLCLISQVYCADQWDKNELAGTINASDIDYYNLANNEATDRLLYTYRQGCALVYASASTITVNSGALALPNLTGSVVRWRRNTSNTTVAWSNIDTGTEANSTTYYIYGVADTDATTFTCVISTNSSAPTGVTYYRRLGSFYNDASGNITQITNDNDITELGSWVSKSADTVYQALTDGMVVGWGQRPSGAGVNFYGYSDSSNPPTTQRIYGFADASGGTELSGLPIFMPVKKGDYYKITAGTGATITIYWMPLD